MGTAAPSGSTATVSPPAQQAERPPRLATAINHVLVDPDRVQDGTDNLPAGQALTAPRLTEIMEHIIGLLDDDAGWAKVWEADGGVHPHPEQLDASGLAEEAWAKCVDEMFLGTAYGGPSIIANIAESEIFRRFSASSDDPAYSLFVACQQLTTYGALARGLSFKDDLREASMAANQSVANIPLFTSGKGQWYTNNPTGQAAPAQPGAPPPAAAPKEITAQQAFDADLVVQAAPGYGGGAIYTYNPLGHTDVIQTDAFFNDVYVDPDGKAWVDPKVSTGLILAAQQGVLEGNKALRDATGAVNKAIPGLNIQPPQMDVGTKTLEELAPLDIPEHLKARAGKVVANMRLRVQLEGSHISMVLRKYTTNTGKHAVQLLDTTAHAQPPGVNGSPDTTRRDYVMFAPLAYMGIFAGEAYGNDGPGQRSIPSGTARFVGMGTLPPLADAGAIEAHLKRARPVGVARLVIIDKRSNPEPTIDDVVFISSAIPMWSTASPTRNYSISRLLFSLRNTPYRKALKAYWIVYAPRNALSVEMWAEGARQKRLGEMEGAWDRVYQVAMCAAILGHEDDGSAVEVWRNRTGSSNGSPPRILKSLFVDTWGPSLEWFNKKVDSFVKEYQADSKRRERKRGELNAEIQRLAPAAQKGDAAAKQRIDDAKAEIDAINKMPPPQAAIDLRALAADPLNEIFQPPPMQARNHLLRTYSPAWLGLPHIPPHLEGGAP